MTYCLIILMANIANLGHGAHKINFVYYVVNKI